MYSQPEVLHALLQKLADAVVTYIKYQADAGAQTVQIFDSWAAQLSPKDFDIFAGPYISYIIQQAKKVRSYFLIYYYLLSIGILTHTNIIIIIIIIIISNAAMP